MACAGTGPLTATSQRGMDGCVEHGGPASSVAHFSFRSRCLVHGYSMSLAIMGLWHVASTQQHSAYCMLRSIDTVDSVCVNVDLRGVIPTARPGPTSQRSHPVTPRHRPSAALSLPLSRSPRRAPAGARGAAARVKFRVKRTGPMDGKKPLCGAYPIAGTVVVKFLINYFRQKAPPSKAQRVVHARV